MNKEGYRECCDFECMQPLYSKYNYSVRQRTNSKFHSTTRPQLPVVCTTSRVARPD